MRRIFGITIAISTAWIGIEAISSGDTILWGDAGRLFSGSNYIVKGHTAVVMGIGWVFATLAALTGLVLPHEISDRKQFRLVSAISFILFALCFIYSAGKSALLMFFPNL
ncbi:MAG: hypothetical protein RJA24_1269 [Pseudomonadota bacterium]|jgi:hypothetical protein